MKGKVSKFQGFVRFREVKGKGKDRSRSKSKCKGSSLPAQAALDPDISQPNPNAFRKFDRALSRRDN